MSDPHPTTPDTTVIPPVAPVPRQRRESGKPRVFDPSMVSAMFAGIAPARVARDYLITYRALIPSRIAAVMGAAVGADPGRLLDELLSLKVTAQMVGAEQLADHAGRLEEFYRDGDGDALAAELADLPETARHLTEAITAALGD